MTISVFDIYSVGIGPSSSHTLGPMRAAGAFLEKLKQEGHLDAVGRVRVDLYGSLALTGEGHGTHKALMLGLSGLDAETIDVDRIPEILEHIAQDQQLELAGERMIPFELSRDIVTHVEKALPKHANGMTIKAYQAESCVCEETYYSIGGGFIVTDATFGHESKATHEVPYPYHTAEDLWGHCKAQSCSIADLIMQNECAMRSEDEVNARLSFLAKEMMACIQRGCEQGGTLPGGLNVRRRANDLYQTLQKKKTSDYSHDEILCWINMCAMAVNEENAAGSRVITSPTNGAAGIIPTVLNYYRVFGKDYSEEGARHFLLTAGAIGILYKQQASISGAEMGCQGEVGVAASMAAGALAAVLGGNLAQVENAAEIAMEHSLGLTCDPVKGLVQIPCIERNAIASVKAINAAHLALAGSGEYKVSLDKVIATMRQTGEDMMTIYKETSLGGLAVNVPDC